MHHRLGSLPQALDAYRRSLGILERAATATSSATDVATSNVSAMLDKVTNAGTVPPLAITHANLGLLHWQLGDVSQAADHVRLAREQMRREGTGLLTERGFVDSMTTLRPELEGALALERAVERLQGHSPSLALPLLLERKSVGLDAKASAVRNFDDASQLRKYRALLARRSLLARGTPANLDEKRAWMREGADIDVQILGLEAEARQRDQEVASVAPITAMYAAQDPRGLAYDEALQEAIWKHQKRLMKDAPDSDSFFAARAEATKRAKAELASKFKDYLAAQQRREHGDRREPAVTDSDQPVEYGRPPRAGAVPPVRRKRPDGSPIASGPHDTAPISCARPARRRSSISERRHQSMISSSSCAGRWHSHAGRSPTLSAGGSTRP